MTSIVATEVYTVLCIWTALYFCTVHPGTIQISTTLDNVNVDIGGNDPSVEFRVT